MIRRSIAERYFAVLWSHKQKCFHYETLDKTIDLGIDVYKKGTGVDYIVVGVCDNCEECISIIKKLKGMRIKYLKEVN